MAHTCHAFECNAVVKPQMFMCFSHWRRVPVALQKLIWKTYRPGQCDDKNISEEYAHAAKTCILAVAMKESKAVPENDPCLRLYDECIGTSEAPSAVAEMQRRLQNAARDNSIGKQIEMSLNSEPGKGGPG